VDPGLLAAVSIGFWKLEKVCSFATALRSGNDVSRLFKVFLGDILVSVPEAPAAIMANAIATGGDAKAAAQPGDTIKSEA
jgi:hypothetical protein